MRPISTLARTAPDRVFWKSTRRWIGGGLLLVVSDVIASELAICLVSLSLSYANASTAGLTADVLVLILAAISIIAANGCLGLYDTAAAPIERFRRRLLGGLLMPWLALAAIVLLRPPTLLDIAVLLLALSLIVPFGLIGEACLRRLFPTAWNAATLLVGRGQAAARLATQLAARPELGLRPVGIVSDDVPATPPLLPWLGRMADLNRATQDVDVIVIVASADTPAMLPAGLPARRVIIVPETTNVPILWLAVRQFGAATGLEFVNPPQTGLLQGIKRGLELSVALPALILSLPLIIVLAGIIKIVSPGPAFYVQHRVGWKGRPVAVPKLRSMYVDAEARLQDVLAADSEARREWTLHMKLSQDPRVLPVIGSFIRKTSFDELPQLWLVVRGDLSLVGPRPFPEYHTTQFSSEFQALRASVKPGLTGLWQVSDRSDANLSEQETIDTFYIRNWSLWLDAYIVLHTLPAMFSARGAR
jgi:Undecaprenyl-phosphate galactose phosphotransferase WbaP